MVQEAESNRAADVALREEIDAATTGGQTDHLEAVGAGLRGHLECLGTDRAGTAEDENARGHPAIVHAGGRVCRIGRPPRGLPRRVRRRPENAV